MSIGVRPSIDIIVPMYNEASGLGELYRQLRKTTDNLDHNFTFIFVNDGSTDDTAARLAVLEHHDMRVHAINLVRNFGKEIALTAGLHASRGDAAILMDADLQHPPQYIPEFISAWQKGSPVVIATRAGTERRSIVRVLGNKLFYAIINYASKVTISPDIMDFRLIDKEVVTYFNSFKERNRITRGLIDWLGFPHTLIPITIPDRAHGASTYSTKMLMRLAKDSLISMSLLPLKISGYLGLIIVSVFGLLGVAVVIDQTFFGDNLKVSGAASLGILTAFMIGVVLVSLGLVALYIANMHEQILGRPLYVVGRRKRRRPTDIAPSVPPPLTVNLQKHTSTVTDKSSAPSVSITKRLLKLKNKPNKILWLSWKDIAHPEAGGAELLSTELRERLVKDGYNVTLLCGSFPRARSEEIVNGVRILRMGSRYSVHIKVFWYFIRHRKDLAPDICIEEVNTAPFFFSWYTRKIPTVLFFHQLAREIWFYELRRVIGAVGYLLESWYIRALSSLPAITVSRSTRLDLLRRGFAMNKISVISEGIDLTPVTAIDNSYKYEQPTVLSLGAVRSMKRTIDQLRAFELAKSSISNLQLIIAGDTSGKYGEQLIQAVATSEYTDDIQLLGRVSEAKKIELMRASHWLLVSSVKEGWGLVVTEAASQGTPSIVYDVDGLRDSVSDGVTGYIVEPKPEAMAEAIIDVFAHTENLEAVQLHEDTLLENDDITQSVQFGYEATRGDPKELQKPVNIVVPEAEARPKPYMPHTRYLDIQRNAWEHSKPITFDNAYIDFKESLGLV